MIQGEKVYLSAVEPENWETLRAWRNLPELRANFREYRELTKGMQEQYWRAVEQDRTQVHFEVHTEKAHRQSVIDDKTGKIIKPSHIAYNELIGYCGLTHISWTNRSGEFGLYIAPEFQGNGYGWDALTTLVKYGFEELNLHRIWCECYSNNDHAVGMYATMGFRSEGILKQHYYHAGQYWDSVIMGLLKEEWEG